MITVGRETHDTPPDMQARLTRAGGRSLAGLPKYRLVWGGSRLDELGSQRYAFAPRLLNRWIVEKSVDGDYKFVTALEGRENEFTPLNLKAIDLIVDLVEKSREHSDFDRREFFRKEQERQSRDYDGFSDSVLDDAMLPMHGQPSVYFGGTKRMVKSASA